MGLSNEELLRKADLTSAGDLSNTEDSSTTAALGIEQVRRFLQLMAADKVMLSDVNTVSSMQAKWQQSVVESGGRILRVGVESTVGASSSVALRQIEMSTGFFKAILPVSDEFFEDISVDDADAAIAAVIADQVGLDVEEICLNAKPSDTEFNDDDAVFDQLPDGGWLAQVEADGNVYDATNDSQDYQTVFRQLLTSIASRFKKNMSTDFRYWVPVILEEKYRDALAARGTVLGDLSLQSKEAIKYQAVPLVAVPSMYIKPGSPDKSHVLLGARTNLYVGFQRQIKIETWRDPREGAKSWIVTTRFDAKVATPEAAALATDVSVEP